VVNDSFVLISRNRTYLWVGAHVPDAKKNIAIKFVEVLKRLRKQNPFSSLAEGLEPENFFEEMNDESGEYETAKFKFSGSSVHECSLTSTGDYRVMHIGSIGQPIVAEDLNTSRFTTLFKFDNLVYIWYPSENVEEREKKNANAAVQSILDDEVDEEDYELKKELISKISVVEIYKGKEPKKFQGLFPAWAKPKEFVDKFVVENEEKQKKLMERIKLAYPFLEKMRIKYKQFLTGDENVNIHNILTLFEVGESRRDWNTFKNAIIDLSNDKFKFTEDFCVDFYKYVLEVTKGGKSVAKKVESEEDDSTESE